MKSLLHAAVSVLLASSTPAAHDPLLEAMQDELQRSVTQLKLEKHDPPYYVAYRIDDSHMLYISATFGALNHNSLTQRRDLKVDVHVGNYSMEGCNSGRGGNPFSSASSQLPTEDNYDAVRYKLWLATDQAYKSAIQNLEMKKAEMQDKVIKERPDDWSHEKPEVEIQPKESLVIDRDAWLPRVRNLSAIFRQYPKIRHSNVDLYDVVDNFYFVNNEGTRVRVPEKLCMLTAVATAEADDGEQVTNHFVLTAPDAAHLPDVKEVEAKLRDFAQRLTDATTGKEAEEYQGPVLFEGEAAAQFFQSALAPHLGAQREPETEAHFSHFSSSNPLQVRLGKRVLPTFISVVDDPGMRDAKGTSLAGTYMFDDQGVRGQKVELVDKGILKTMLCTRSPSLKFKNSNGHGFNTHLQISNLVIKSSQPSSRDNLIGRLKELGKDEGLEYVYVVRCLHSGNDRNSFDPSDLFGGDKIKLPNPLMISRLYLSDGHEEPVRAASFGSSTLRILRDIVATGNDDRTYDFVHNYTQSCTVTCPSILVSELEIQKSNRNLEKAPVLPHPYFEKASAANAASNGGK